MAKIKPQKRLGQNFLIDDAIANAIVREADVKGRDVLEIGPGTGALTFKLADVAKRLVAVELDRRLYNRLKERMEQRENVVLVWGNIMNVNLDDFFEGQFAVVANLPYYITTPIIMRLMEFRAKIDKVVVMVQKEVGRRIVAVPGSKDYGALSIAVQYNAIPELVLEVPRECFKPQPAVDSVVVRMRMREKPLVDVNEENFFKVVRAAFSSRRKTLLNALYGNIAGDKNVLRKVIVECGIDPGARAETLSLYQFACLSNKLEQLLF
ncbi:16S rRNA (adenine(1518)-N(6)/adenine(1519)-N(6))-dimethyltransferase RsmA [Caldanaerobius polysaccharolyticus]|uniref:16S rRNA (adenine(1518)-N(6)/adenine(1519)-N(6))- dimethyltransferase RsmA n=1 Tax=Caldanaerobius polysaccharolyticus TaxID=44256 RepID=UPI00068B78C5|nr:16S rRNA (adenine(1518)-N(6)/adenine(1519)-N(6))-dimethyltransferase RsmA [Caldanaerobius polysaccharolyticus]